jgi:hypothetical protein
MANDLDQFPIYDSLIKKDTDKMSDVWVTNLSTFHQNLTGYLSSYGVFLPSLTTAQRDAIQSPQNGQMIYNTTLNSAQYFKNGAWSSF